MTGFEMSEEELEDDEKRKQEIFEKVYCELGDVMDCDDEAIM